jgi:hypothetical protein
MCWHLSQLKVFIGTRHHCLPSLQLQKRVFNDRCCEGFDPSKLPHDSMVETWRLFLEGVVTSLWFSVRKSTTTTDVKVLSGFYVVRSKVEDHGTVMTIMPTPTPTRIDHCFRWVWYLFYSPRVVTPSVVTNQPTPSPLSSLLPPPLLPASTQHLRELFGCCCQ